MQDVAKNVAKTEQATAADARRLINQALRRDGADVMSQLATFLKDVRHAKAIEYAFAFLKTGREYAFAYLKTMDRSEVIGYAVVAAVTFLLTIALT